MFSYQLNIMRQIILTEILVLFSNAAICNKNYKSVCLVIINVPGNTNMECFWTWQSSSLVVVDDVVLRCRWWFIKSCQLHISVTQEWLFGELETKFPFSADCLRVEEHIPDRLSGWWWCGVRTVPWQLQNPVQGFVKTIFQKNDFNTSKPTWSVPTTF